MIRPTGAWRLVVESVRAYFRWRSRPNILLQDPFILAVLGLISFSVFLWQTFAILGETSVLPERTVAQIQQIPDMWKDMTRAARDGGKLSPYQAEVLLQRAEETRAKLAELANRVKGLGAKDFANQFGDHTRKEWLKLIGSELGEHVASGLGGKVAGKYISIPGLSPEQIVEAGVDRGGDAFQTVWDTYTTTTDAKGEVQRLMQPAKFSRELDELFGEIGRVMKMKPDDLMKARFIQHLKGLRYAFCTKPQATFESELAAKADYFDRELKLSRAAGSPDSPWATTRDFQAWLRAKTLELVAAQPCLESKLAVPEDQVFKAFTATGQFVVKEPEGLTIKKNQMTLTYGGPGGRVTGRGILQTRFALSQNCPSVEATAEYVMTDGKLENGRIYGSFTGFGPTFDITAKTCSPTMDPIEGGLTAVVSGKTVIGRLIFRESEDQPVFHLPVELPFLATIP